MSQPCDVADCKRAARALCYCCNQNLCRLHLNEHDDILNSQLNPFVDEINLFNDRIKRINIKNIVEHDHEQLEHWRRESYRLIDEYVSEKKSRLDQSMNTKVFNLSTKMSDLKTIVNQLIRKQDTTSDDLNSILLSIQHIRREISQLEYKSNNISINPLDIDHKLIQIESEYIKNDFNLSTFTSPIHATNRSVESSKPLSTNGKVLLTHNENQLCLLNQDMIIVKCTPWCHSWIWDMCWSSTLARFCIITRNQIFTLDPNTMSLERLEVQDTYSFCSCTCSDTSLLVTTNELSSSIYEFSLTPTIELIHRWQSADLCRENERIQDMIFHKGTIALIIDSETSQKKRMELRLAENFEKVWTIQFDHVDPLHNVYRLCLFNCNEWLVIDWKLSQIFYITRDGQLQSICKYDSIPYRCCQFGSNMLAVSTKHSINFHKI